MWINSGMKIKEITSESISLHDQNDKVLLAKLFKRPITVRIAKDQILPMLNTPLFNDLLISLEKLESGDIRPEIVDYLDAEYPQISNDFRDFPMKREDNLEGTLSPLGHKDEEA